MPETTNTLLPRFTWVAPEHPSKPPECPKRVISDNAHLERLEAFIQGGYEDWDAHDLATLGAFIELMKGPRDCSAPFDYFVHSCVMHYRFHPNHTTPEDAEDWFEEFRQNFRHMREDVRYALERYPDLLKEDEPAPAQ
jgi:hypothetical protein